MGQMSCQHCPGVQLTKANVRDPVSVQDKGNGLRGSLCIHQLCHKNYYDKLVFCRAMSRRTSIRLGRTVQSNAAEYIFK